MRKASAYLLAALFIIGAAGCTSRAPQQTGSTPWAATATPQATTPYASPKDYLEIGLALMQSEAVGEFKINMTQSQIIDLVGQPDTKSKTQVWAADGLAHTTWIYQDDGISLDMTENPDTHNESVVYSIYAYAPCALSTRRQIKLGDTKETVWAAYYEEIDDEQNAMDDDAIVIGSAYGGIQVTFKDGAVDTIFIGAMAE